jgi:hypothetical protein
MHKRYSYIIPLVSFCTAFSSCEKLITVPPPRHTITTAQVFDSDAQAEGAISGLYTGMINGLVTNSLHQNATKLWAAGLVTLHAGLSAGEFINTDGISNVAHHALATNRLSSVNSNTGTIWNSAYKTIYMANSVIEGIAASESATLTAKTRTELTGEAKFVRAMTFFYLVNLFGDVPLTLTVDFHQTRNMKRTPAEQVYNQIISDLKEARNALRTDFSNGNNERVRPNKWAAAALLSRVYLFTGDHSNAAAMATEVINQTALYELATDPAVVFQANNREAIWQLKQTTLSTNLRNATPEGYLFNSSNRTNTPGFNLTSHLLSAFEPGDKRWSAWLDSSSNTAGGVVGVKSYYPAKYKIGSFNNSATTPKEYYMVLRLAELFLIRSEARAYGVDGGPSAAVDDLNMIRKRAGLEKLPNTLDKEAVLSAIEKERQIELFAEWGHRWLDLKRTGRAGTALASIALKQPWEGDYQLLYPIPNEEIEGNINIIQNPGYIL